MMSSTAIKPTAMTTTPLRMKNTRSRATEAIPLASGIVEFRSKTRRLSPNICPKKPSCPAASDESRNARVRVNDISRLSSSSVRRHAQVFTTSPTPPRAITRLSRHPSAAMLCDQICGTGAANQENQEQDSEYPCQ